MQAQSAWTIPTNRKMGALIKDDVFYELLLQFLLRFCCRVRAQIQIPRKNSPDGPAIDISLSLGNKSRINSSCFKFAPI